MGHRNEVIRAKSEEKTFQGVRTKQLEKSQGSRIYLIENVLVLKKHY